MTERWKQVRNQMMVAFAYPDDDHDGMLSYMRLFEEACKRIAELEAERRWIPVGERLPGEGEYAVGLFRHHRMHVLKWQAGQWCDWHGDPVVLIEPTHWTPLPKPPEATDAD